MTRESAPVTQELLGGRQDPPSTNTVTEWMIQRSMTPIFFLDFERLLAALELRYPDGHQVSLMAPRLFRRSAGIRYVYPVHE